MKMFKAISELTYIQMSDLFKDIGIDMSVSTVRRRSTDGEFMSLTESVNLIKYLNSNEGLALKSVIDKNVGELKVVINMLNDTFDEGSVSEIFGLLDDELEDDEYLNELKGDVPLTKDLDDDLDDDDLEDDDLEDDDLEDDDLEDDDLEDDGFDVFPVAEDSSDDDLDDLMSGFDDEVIPSVSDVTDGGTDEPWSDIGKGRKSNSPAVKDSFESSGMDEDEWGSDNHTFDDKFDSKG